MVKIFINTLAASAVAVLNFRCCDHIIVIYRCSLKIFFTKMISEKSSTKSTRQKIFRELYAFGLIIHERVQLYA